MGDRIRHPSSARSSRIPQGRHDRRDATRSTSRARTRSASQTKWSAWANSIPSKVQRGALTFAPTTRLPAASTSPPPLSGTRRDERVRRARGLRGADDGGRRRAVLGLRRLSPTRDVSRRIGCARPVGMGEVVRPRSTVRDPRTVGSEAGTVVTSSATITSAVRRAMPGIVSSRASASASATVSVSTRRSYAAMVSSRNSMWRRRCSSMKR
jgi:hypothetical protein